MKIYVAKFKTEKVLHFFYQINFQVLYDYQVYRILGVDTAAGSEAKAEAPWSVINKYFYKSYRKVSR